MKARLAIRLLTMLAGCGLLISPSVCYGWSEIAHCTIGELTGTGAGYNNLPDFWGSTRDFAGIPYSISPYFCWAHEYKITADKGYRLRRMYEPTLNMSLGAEDDCPSHYFDILIGKMDLTHVTDSVRRTIRGWRAHNAADQVVHYTLFPAPLAGANAYQVSQIWLRHRNIEEAVEKFVYVEVLFDGHEELAFDKRGRVVGYNFIGGVACGDADSDRFLMLAQKAFRKKQATVDTVEMWGLDMQTANQIRSLREAKVNKMRHLFNFTIDDYHKALQDYHDIVDIWPNFFNRAVTAVRALP